MLVTALGCSCVFTGRGQCVLAHNNAIVFYLSFFLLVFLFVALDTALLRYELLSVKGNY